MFDQTSSTTINLVPEAATALPPVRVELGNNVHWLRPSNVLRVEAASYDSGTPMYLHILLSDGTKLSHPCDRMGRRAFLDLANSVVATLWPDQRHGEGAK